jgi:hypothetical protein
MKTSTVITINNLRAERLVLLVKLLARIELENTQHKYGLSCLSETAVKARKWKCFFEQTPSEKDLQNAFNAEELKQILPQEGLELLEKIEKEPLFYEFK